MAPEGDPELQRLQAGLDALPPVERTIEDGRIRETRRFRGVTLDRAVGYLENLGGERNGDRTVVGPGWRADLTERTVPVGPSYRLTEIEITWTGDREAVEPLIFRFRLKTFRAPG